MKKNSDKWELWEIPVEGFEVAHERPSSRNFEWVLRVERIVLLVDGT